MNQLKEMTAVVLLISVAVASSVAGPWTRKKDSWILRAEFSMNGYSSVYGDDGDRRPLAADVHDNLIQLLCDYGLSDEMTISIAVPVKFLSVRLSGSQPVSTTTAHLVSGNKNGFGDIDFGVRRGWWQDDGYVFSTELMAGIPTGDYEDERGLYLGDSEANLTIRCLLGKSFAPVPFYVTADIGYNLRSRDFPSDVLYSIEAGYGLPENNVSVMLLLSGRKSTSTSQTIDGYTATKDKLASELGLLTKNQEFTAIVPKVLVRFAAGWGASVSFATLLHGRNVAGDAVLAGGVFCEF